MILRTFMLSLPLIFFLFFFLTQPIYSQNFRCNELLSAADEQNLLTFEYRDPETGQRGVVCMAMLNDRESMVVYMEEEVNGMVNSKGVHSHKHEHKHHSHKHEHGHSKHHEHPHRHTHASPKSPQISSRKQAVARAHRSSTSSSLYTGILHVLHNISDKHEDIYDLDGAHFTLKFTPETGLVTVTIKSRLSQDDIVAIWHPRAVVNNWIMRVNVPKSCGADIKALRIADPIPRNPPDRQGIVCILQNTPNSLKYFSLGWRKAGTSGRPRKFINFGSLRSASTKFINIYTGRVHALEFPSPCHTKNVKTDRLAFKDTLIISAVKSVNSATLMIYGDLQEIWYDPSTKIDPAAPPKYPLIPNNFDSDYTADIKQIYGF